LRKADANLADLEGTKTGIQVSQPGTGGKIIDFLVNMRGGKWVFF
jgi:hypothetical protein